MLYDGIIPVCITGQESMNAGDDYLVKTQGLMRVKPSIITHISRLLLASNLINTGDRQ